MSWSASKSAATGLGLFAQVLRKLDHAPQRAIDRGVVRERRADVRVELNQPGNFEEASVVLSAHPSGSREIGFRDIAGVDLAPVLDWRGFGGKLKSISSVNHGNPVLHASSRASRR